MIGVECVALASGAVQGQHELTDRALAQRVRSYERFELGDQVSVPACSEVRVDAILDHGESLLLEAATGFVCEPLVAQVEKRRPPLERERLGLAAFAGQALESLEIELILLDAQQVPRIPRLEPAVPKLLAQVGDTVLENLQRRRRRPLVPEDVDQRSTRHHLIGMEQEVGEERLLLAAPDRDRPSVLDDLQGTQDGNSTPVPRIDRSTGRPGCLARRITGELPPVWPVHGPHVGRG